MTDLATSMNLGRTASAAVETPRTGRSYAGRHLSVRLIASVGVYFGVYLAWRLSSWGGAETRLLVGYAFFVPPGVAAATFAWLASRRCGDRQTASAWRWIAASIVFLTVTFAVDLWYQKATGAVPFPSVADACYLAFYPLFLIGVLRFPKRRESRAGTFRLWLDLTTVGLAGACVIWFLVLGPTFTASGQNLVDGSIAGAYPVGDLLQIFGLTYAMLRLLSHSTRSSLRLLAAGTLLALVGDVTAGWMALHAEYSLKLAVDIAFMGAWAFFVLGGAAQGLVRPTQQEQPTRDSVDDRGAGLLGWAVWGPYSAPAVFFGLLIYSQFDGLFFERFSLAVGAAMISLLVLSRQFLSRRDLLAAQGQLSYQALHDALTGLPNRVLVLDRTEQMLARAHRQQATSAALFVDVDGFKHVNDTFGHAAGDQLLQAVAARLSGVVREADTVGRLGGDEFVVLLDCETLDARPELVAERILEVLRQPVELDHARERPLLITVSIGVATGHRASAAELLRDADVALYQAKESGKDRYVLFESRMQTVADDRLRLEMDLRGAIEGEQLFLLYQPTFDLQTRAVNGVEALIRWRHPARGVVAPNLFIPIAEKTGMIVPIGRWVLATACRQAADWHRRGKRIGVSVNISGRQLDGEELVVDVRAALTSSGLDPAALTLEITETALMRDTDAAARRLGALKDLGVRIAIDDFGTGYSSLAYLRQFRVDTLKIDRSFISGVASEESAALIHTLVQLGKALGLSTLGEGIEEQGQLRRLQREKCDYGQGFLLARPLDVEALEEFLEMTPTDQLAPGQPPEPGSHDRPSTDLTWRGHAALRVS